LLEIVELSESSNFSNNFCSSFRRCGFVIAGFVIALQKLDRSLLRRLISMCLVPVGFKPSDLQAACSSLSDISSMVRMV